MKILALTVLILIACTNVALSQKRSSIRGDNWIGVVTATDDNTREIRLRAASANEDETFVGILEEGYQVKMKDGSLRELKVSEIHAGTRVRVLYKTKQQEVNGRKIKVNTITKIYLLPKDEFVVLREKLNLPISTLVTFDASKSLPEVSPLKMFVVVDDVSEKKSFMKWVEVWNKKDAQKYGAIELVPDVAQADVFLVMHEGSNNPTLGAIPIWINGATRIILPMTAFLGRRKDDGVEVFWKQGVLVTAEGSTNLKSLLGEKLEDRLKARHKAQKK